MFDYSTIFILFSCNEWKEYSSMRFIAASTNVSNIHVAIIKEIRQGNMDYDGLTKHAGAKLFHKSLINGCVNLDLLDYGYVIDSKNLAAVKRNNK